MRYLFYLVHPAKFQFHKAQIKALREHGHVVDIIINSKDVLEELIKEENWEYTNIFPDGRPIKGLHPFIAAVLNFFITIFRLVKYTNNKKYDLFIGDLLTVVGRLKRIPSLYPTDDVIRQVPLQAICLLPCNHIIAPTITELGIFNKKKVCYDGYKALTYIHPNVFTPSVQKINPRYHNNKMIVIRCTGFAAHHDRRRKGIDNAVLEKIVDLLKDKGDIVISSERELPPHLEQFRFMGNKNDIFHYMAYADIFIGDSVTMCTEAALLGTPVVEYDTYWFEMEQLLELQFKYKLINLFQPPNIEPMLEKIQEIIEDPNCKITTTEARDKFIDEKIDVNHFLIWFMENYPKSFEAYKRSPFVQYQFK